MNNNRKKVIAFLCALVVIVTSVAGLPSFRYVEAADTEGVTEVVTFADFGVKDDTYGLYVSSSGSLDLTASGNCGKTSLDGILFHGKVKFSEEAPFTICFFGKNNGWQGLRLSSKTDGNLYLNFIKANNISGYAKTLYSATAGTKLTGAEIDLKLSIQYVDHNGDDVKDDVKLGILFNDVLYNNEHIYLDGAVDNLGSYIGVLGDKSNVNSTVAVASVWDLEEITFADFGVKDDTYERVMSSSGTDVSLTTNGTCGKTSMDGILFHGKVKFSEEAPFTISFFGSDSGWKGFRLSSRTDGNLYLNLINKSGWSGGTKILYSDTAGTELTGVEIDLKMSVQYADQDGDGIKDDVKLGIWFNDKLYENKLIYLDGAAANLGSYIGIFGDKSNANSTVAVASVWDLEEITFAHLGVEDGTYGLYVTANGSLDLTTSGRYGKNSLDGILFHGKVMFSEEAPFTISFFGSDSGWKGFRLSSRTDGNLYLNFIKANNVSGYAKTLFSATAGTKLTGAEIDLKMSVQYADQDGDGVKDDVKLGIWFNDILYENKLIYLEGAVANLGSYIGFFGDKSNADSTVAVKSVAKTVFYEDISSYRTDTKSAPVLEGYAFAGWYTDKDCIAPLSVETTAGSAYAKFVEKDALTVKVQITAGTTAESETTDMRFVTTVDNLQYEKIGFEVTANGNTRTVASNNVYKQLFAVGSDKVMTYKPNEEFSPVSTYFKACTITGIPNSAFNWEWTVRPYWITLDGTTVYGETAVKTVTMGIGL